MTFAMEHRFIFDLFGLDLCVYNIVNTHSPNLTDTVEAIEKRFIYFFSVVVGVVVDVVVDAVAVAVVVTFKWCPLISPLNLTMLSLSQ